MIPIGNGESAPADLVVSLQLEEYGLHSKQVAFVMLVSMRPSSPCVCSSEHTQSRPSWRYKQCVCSAGQAHVAVVLCGGAHQVCAVLQLAQR